MVTQAEISKKFEFMTFEKGVPHEFQIALKKRFSILGPGTSYGIQCISVYHRLHLAPSLMTSHKPPECSTRAARCSSFEKWSARHRGNPETRAAAPRQRLRRIDCTAAVLVESPCPSPGLVHSTTKVSLQWDVQVHCR